MLNQRFNKVAALIQSLQFQQKPLLMLGLSVKALKSPYLQEDLFKEAFKSKFLMSICLRSKGFKVYV